MRRSAAYAGLTLTEVLVAIVVTGVVLPALINTQLTNKRLDVAQLARGRSLHITRVVMENIHYRMYNGYRTDPADPSSRLDPRGYLLNDPPAERKKGQANGSYLAFFNSLAEREAPVVGGKGTTQSQYFQRLVHVKGALAPQQLDIGSNPEAASALENFRLSVDVVLHVDDAPRPPRRSKEAVEPDVDMAQLWITVAWPAPLQDGTLSHGAAGRYTRYLYEPDLNRKVK